jgi:type I restriction enzyme S subunit
MLDAQKNKGSPVAYLRNVNVRWGEFDLSDLQEMRATQDELEELSVRNGDIFVCEGGEPGRAAVWRNGVRELIFQKALHRLRTIDLIQPDYLAQYIKFSASQHEFLSLLTGTTIKHLPQVALQRMRIAVPPAAEQCRIVSKLDVLIAHLARTRVELDRIPILAMRFRTQTVRSAYRGELTADWRARNRGQLAIAKGSADLPVGWRWTTLGELAQIKSGVTLGKRRAAEATLVQVPYLRVANVQRGALNLAIIKRIAVTPAEAEALLLRAGDILLNEGGDRDKLGRGWVWSGEIDNCIHQNHVFRARLIENDDSPKYVSYYANEFGQDYFLEHGTQTTNLASISKAKLSALPIPMAPPKEQAEIVILLERTFARADRLEADAARARALLDWLEAAILAKAFRGELVPQDPNDEPASVLLERIKAARSQQAQSQPIRRRKASVPKSPREKAIMTKSRQDEDVKNKPYLANIIREAGGSSDVEDVFKKADLPVTDFYKQLAWEVDQGHIHDQNNQTLRVA